MGYEPTTPALLSPEAGADWYTDIARARTLSRRASVRERAAGLKNPALRANTLGAIAARHWDPTGSKPSISVPFDWQWDQRPEVRAALARRLRALLAALKGAGPQGVSFTPGDVERAHAKALDEVRALLLCELTALATARGFPRPAVFRLRALAAGLPCACAA